MYGDVDLVKMAGRQWCEVWHGGKKGMAKPVRRFRAI